MATEHREHSVGGAPYQHLIVMAALSLVSMYFLMYAMVDQPANVYGNLNQLFMAGLMTAPMIVIELVVMRGMYPNRKRNAVISAASVALGVAMFLLIRQQTAIADEQFLRSMIPHHSGAILMCQRAQLRDAQLRELCDSIISSQQEEISLMAAMLEQRK
jgi:fucose 4-O-acetylase-like acetyltransferase